LPTSTEGALRLLSAPSGRFWQEAAICPVSLWSLVVELHPLNCARAQFSGCSSIQPRSNPNKHTYKFHRNMFHGSKTYIKNSMCSVDLKCLCRTHFRECLQITLSSDFFIRTVSTVLLQTVLSWGST
jgi:hypothetical protein